jgi:hypothetical protein
MHCKVHVVTDLVCILALVSHLGHTWAVPGNLTAPGSSTCCSCRVPYECTHGACVVCVESIRRARGVRVLVGIRHTEAAVSM